MKNLLTKLTPHKYFLAILAIGMFLRLFHAKELFLYSHDQDLSAWFIKDVLVDHHIRLIGQETSVKGLFIGPVFYYLLIPFYLITNLDPIGGLLLPVVIAFATIASIYFIFTKIFNKTTASIASLIYSTNFAVILTDKEVVPTTPVYLWTVWYLYSLYLITKKDKKALILIAVLSAFTWHINLTLAILFILVPVSLVLTKYLPSKKTTASSMALALVLNAPFFAFEFRHGFQQTKTLLASFSHGSAQTLSYSQTFLRTTSVMAQNAQAFLWNNLINTPQILSLIIIASVLFL